MASSVWYEIQGGSSRFPNIESVRSQAIEDAKNGDGVVEVYKVTRTLVRTVQRSVTVTETDVPAT